MQDFKNKAAIELIIQFIKTSSKWFSKYEIEGFLIDKGFNIESNEIDKILEEMNELGSLISHTYNYKYIGTTK